MDEDAIARAKERLESAAAGRPDPAAVEAALERLEPDRGRAERVVAERGGGVRTARLLARRGFGEDAVEAAAWHGVAEAGAGELG
jgi:hypothetical protein